ncbi:NAD binding domain of 6-phosphogluconate dehydrogenase-domain-containing protein [Diplogelasinospora grovesii]|uniref:3-hydroxyisobutyrate dehydrogenase n=1 Tax=Diplogelasinospora grovesii TaxID=303347 RepID=A0AAN6MUB1_9PEZI|nr:NAD binding domain of 6-phosphogluconate dehydrogenase-domain-containing protein [Diplogelasinospora grovesii]
MYSHDEAIDIGFIGLGAMGKPMVVNLAKKLPRGSRLYIYDVVPDAMDELSASFPDIIVRCTCARDVAKHGEIVLTMLPEGSHVKSVYLDDVNGILAALDNPAHLTATSILIDCSTIDTATNLYIKQQLLDKSPMPHSFYDAPVSGGVLGAVNGTIAFFLGCSEHDGYFPGIANFLSLIGEKIIPCGGSSLGLAAKLSNNYLSGIITIACSEAMDMGMRAGIDPRTLAAVFKAGTAQNTICDVFNPVPGVCPDAPPSKGYQGGFRVGLMKKDMGLAVAMARRLGTRNVLGMTGLGVYTAAAEAQETKDLDSRVVYRYLGGQEDWQQNQEVD